MRKQIENGVFNSLVLMNAASFFFPLLFRSDLTREIAAQKDHKVCEFAYQVHFHMRTIALLVCCAHRLISFHIFTVRVVDLFMLVLSVYCGGSHVSVYVIPCYLLLYICCHRNSFPKVILSCSLLKAQERKRIESQRCTLHSLNTHVYRQQLCNWYIDTSKP